MAESVLSVWHHGNEANVTIGVGYQPTVHGIRDALIEMTSAYDEARKLLASFIGEDD